MEDPNRNPILLKIDPQKIRFTRKNCFIQKNLLLLIAFQIDCTINSTFKDGRKLKDTIESLKSGTLHVESIPRISVAFHQNSIWTLDNRRLYVFQKVQIEEIEVEVVNRSNKFWRKLTNKNNGKDIVVIN